MRTSLIVSVYKNIADLEVVLKSIEFQSFKDFEIVISEDGEYEPMASFLSQYKSTFKVTHLTQPDMGWRKNRALNNAIRASQGDYLVFIDGDCVLHQKFMENHIRLSGKEKIVAGKRVKLGPLFSNLFRNNIENLPELQTRVEREWLAIRKDGVKFYEEAFYFNPAGLLGFIPRLRSMTELKGCNMSFYRDAIERINGFDEDYTLPAIGEDIDLTWRFIGMGYTLSSARNLAVQYHLHHKENWTDQSENLAKMKLKKFNNEFVCHNGITSR
jgi:cellulose synthase/poly-beta-1,6-N-acetylglucosamine synthase-like glycosyltransferase